MMKYNFVVFGSEDPYYTLGYDELNSRNDSLYYSNPFCFRKNNTVVSMLRKIHMTPRLNRYVNLPGKSVWNSKLFSETFENDKPICFIFFSAGSFADHIPYGLIEYLKKIYSNSKYVVFYQDLVGANRRTVSLEMYQKKMDLLISFDYADCEKYNMLYHPLVYSDISGRINAIEEKSDIYFCGAEKNRLNEIIEAYSYFQDLGLKCDFNVITSNEELLRNNKSGINYCSSFSYLDNLRHIKSCRAMLEIMQKGGTGFTIRALECVAFNKKLITNNDFIKKADFYEENNIIGYNKSYDENVYRDFIKNKATSYEYMQYILPHKLLEFIDENL